MKRTICLICTFALLYFGFSKADANVLSNVIALSSSDDDEMVECYNTITTDSCKMVLYCGTCSFIPGDNTLFSGKSKCEPKIDSSNPSVQ